jgi:hypothetical protein
MKKTIIFILACAFGTSAIAQDFNYQGQIEIAKKTEYHKILLAPEITGPMTRGLADIRIYSETQREIPYVLRSESHATRQTGFKQYKIYDRDYNRGWDYESRYLIRNDEGTTIDHIVLKIRNFSDNKRVRISGSDDGNQWFTIKNGYTFHEVTSATDAFNYKVVHFPKSNYKFYKLESDDRRHRDPINIMEAGYFTDDLEHGSYQAAIVPNLTQTEDREKKTSTIKVQWPHSQWVDKLRLDINTEENFHRRAELFVKYYNEDSTFYMEKVKTFWLSSTQLNELRFNKFKCKEMHLVIDNKDNYPVKINDALAFQLKHYLIAELKKGEQYFVQFGNRMAKKPEYDIVYFTDEIPAEMKQLRTFNAQRLDVFRPEAEIAPVVNEGPYLTEEPAGEAENPTPQIEEEVPFFKQKTFIWLCIGLVIVFLGFMSIKMMGEVGKDGEPEE